MVITRTEDPWEKICNEINFKDELNWFVTPPIRRSVISKFGVPSKLIPIYSEEELRHNHPFLYDRNLTPFRIGRGDAVLTKANLFQDISPVLTNNQATIEVPKHDTKGTQSFLYFIPNTEAKYLTLAFNLGVFDKSFNNATAPKLKLGNFGKFTLKRTTVNLLDTHNDTVFPISISNVQFELDFSLENDDSIFLIEAKKGRRKSFSALQLFYPNIMMQEYAFQTGKKIRNILVDIQTPSVGTIKYRLIEFDFLRKTVPNSIHFKKESSVKVDLAIQRKLF